MEYNEIYPGVLNYQWSEFMRISAIFTTVAALAMFALASPATAYHATGDIDGCGDAPTKGTDISSLNVSSKAVSGEDGVITVEMNLCGAPVKGAKYRVHFDYKGEFASSRNEACKTLSDTIGIHSGGSAASKNGSPVIINLDKASMSYSRDSGTVTVEKYSIVFRVRYQDLGVFSGDDMEIWADIQSDGVADRAPNTDGSDGCAKPQDGDEVLAIELVD